MDQHFFLSKWKKNVENNLLREVDAIYLICLEKYIQKILPIYLLRLLITSSKAIYIFFFLAVFLFYSQKRKCEFMSICSIRGQAVKSSFNILSTTTGLPVCRGNCHPTGN